MSAEFEARIEPCVRAVKGGDRAAYRELVEAALPMVRAFVVGRSLPAMDVDDIVQRTFIEAYQNLGEYQAGTNFRAWLVTIARYQCLREATRVQRQADYHSRFVPLAIARQMEQQVTVADYEDRRIDYLRECLTQVGDKARELIRHRYEDDLPMAEIATALGRTSGAIRKELCLIRKQLHECVEKKIAAEATSP